MDMTRYDGAGKIHDMPGPVPCRATWKLKKMCWILVPAVRTAKATSWCAFHSAPSSQHALLDSQGHRSIAWRNRLTPPEIWKHMETENITTNHLSYLSITSSHRASTQQLDSLDMCFDMCFDMCWPSSPCHLLPLLPFHSSSSRNSDVLIERLEKACSTTINCWWKAFHPKILSTSLAALTFFFHFFVSSNWT